MNIPSGWLHLPQNTPRVTSFWAVCSHGLTEGEIYALLCLLEGSLCCWNTVDVFSQENSATKYKSPDWLSSRKWVACNNIVYRAFNRKFKVPAWLVPWGMALTASFLCAFWKRSDWCCVHDASGPKESRQENHGVPNKMYFKCKMSQRKLTTVKGVAKSENLIGWINEKLMISTQGDGNFLTLKRATDKVNVTTLTIFRVTNSYPVCLSWPNFSLYPKRFIAGCQLNPT